MKKDDVNPYWFGDAADAPEGTLFVMPRHPAVPRHPAPFVTRWLDEGEPQWTAGPWKTVVKAARAGGWVVKAFVARNHTLDSRGHIGALTDTLSIRCWKANAAGDLDRAVALWSRATWPVLGRARKAADDEERSEHTGEGRATTEGKTWLWHPPMPLPDLVDGKDPLAVSWKASGRWVWTEPSAPSPRPVSAAEFTAWLKRIPGLVPA